MEGVEPTHPHGYQILSLARLPIPPHRPKQNEYSGAVPEVNYFARRESLDIFLAKGMASDYDSLELRRDKLAKQL
jgi:hypothetical protein